MVVTVWRCESEPNIFEHSVKSIADTQRETCAAALAAVKLGLHIVAHKLNTSVI